MKKAFSVLLFVFIVIAQLSAQNNNVGIGTTTPNATAILDVTSTNKGVLVPRLTTAQRTAITNPAQSLLVYDTDLGCFYYYNSITSAWVSLCQAGPAGPTGAQGITGAAGTNGVAGATGPSGADGAAGAAGPAGAAGAPGAPGAAGPAGANGAQGAAGAPGANGATGPTGPIGPGGTGSLGPTGPTGATGVQGVAGASGTNGVTGPTGTNGVTGPTGVPSANSYNTAFTYSASTGVLSITDGGGTLTTNITPMRASVCGTTNITTSSATYSAMAGTTLTFTPNKSTVYIHASAAGYCLVTNRVPNYVGVRVYNITAAAVVTGGASLGMSMYDDVIGDQYTTTSWNVSLVTPMTVTPNVPVTIRLDWQVTWADGNNAAAYCNPASDPESQRCIIVSE